jgi:carbamoyl-phosphate synthase large subunit
MRSTGEVMSFGENFPQAFAKAQIAAGNPLPTAGTVLVSLADMDKREGVALVGQLYDKGFNVVATRGTSQALQAMGIPAQTVLKVGEGRPDCVDIIVQGKIDLVVNTPSADGQERQQLPAPPLPATAQERGVRLPWAQRRSAGYRIRTAALECHVPYITTLVALRATVAAIRALRPGHVAVKELSNVSKMPRLGTRWRQSDTLY